MASKGREFSLIPTLLLSLVIGTMTGVLLLLLFGRHTVNAGTVSAVNSGMPGTTLINRTVAAADQVPQAGAADAGTTGTASGSTKTANAAAGVTAAGTTAAGVAASAPSANSVATTGTVNDTATSQSGSGIDAQKEALSLSQTVVGDQFTGTGAQIYVQACQSCHQSGGVGAKGAGIYPALANNPRLSAAAYPETMVLYGNGGMPGFGHYMNDQQIADVVNYVRTELNKNTDKVTPEDIKKLRPTKPDYMIFGEAAG